MAGFVSFKSISPSESTLFTIVDDNYTLRYYIDNQQIFSIDASGYIICSDDRIHELFDINIKLYGMIKLESWQDISFLAYLLSFHDLVKFDILKPKYKLEFVD